MSILAQIGTEVGSSLKTLDTRLSSAEQQISALGGQQPPPSGFFTVSPVQWTNLTEINLSGEKAQNISFDPPPLAIGVEVEILNSWSNGGKTASVGEIYTIDLVQSNGGMRLTNSSQSIFASANQLATQVKALNPPEGQVVETIAEFTSNLVGREIRSLVSNSNRNMVAGEITTITEVFGTTQVRHSGGDGTKNIVLAQQGSGWELLSETIRKPYLWTVAVGTLDQEKLAQGIIKGFDASAGVQQMFATPLTVGTKIVVKVQRSDTNSGSVAFKHVKLDGNTRGGDVHIPRDDGFVEHTVTDTDMYGIRFATMFGAREIDSVSVFQGEVSGGTVQANGNGGLEKIAGADGYNAGASSTNSIGGNENGYVQFQIAHPTNSVRIGLVTQDVDYNVNPPHFMNFGGGNIDFQNPFLDNYATYENGDFFRIRHYAQTNEIKFQKKQTVYDDTDYVFPATPTSGNNHHFDTADRPLVQAVEDSNRGLVAGELYRMYAINVVQSSGQFEVAQLYEMDGTSVGWFNRSYWQVVKEIGQDYVTFYTHPVLSNGNNLFVDASLHTIGSRLNDCLLAK